MLSWTQPALATGLNDLGGWFWSSGGAIGATWRDSSPAFHFGIETSVVHLDDEEGWWYGGYADAIRESGQTRLSLGPEVGWAMLGMDAAVLMRDDGEIGVVLRPMLTFAICSAYYRHGRYFTTEGSFHEVGLLVKLPAQLTKE